MAHLDRASAPHREGTTWGAVLEIFNCRHSSDDAWAQNVADASARVLRAHGAGLLIVERTSTSESVRRVATATSSTGHRDKNADGCPSTEGLVVRPEADVILFLYVSVAPGSALGRYDRMLLGRLCMYLETSWRGRKRSHEVEATVDARGGVSFRPGRSRDIWHSLLRGQCSLLQQGGRSDRRYDLLENAPHSVDARALTEDEIAVLSDAASGRSVKLIAYSRGLVPPTVSLRLGSAASKIGVASGADLVRLAAVLGSVPQQIANAASLTNAETDILELLQRGLSNEEIATARARSVRTIANQVASLLRKTGSPSRRALLACAALGSSSTPPEGTRAGARVPSGGR